jgi:excisionase family DNA binding protein
MAVVIKPKPAGINPESHEILTRAEAARYLRVSQAHLSNLVHAKVPGAPQLRCSWAGRRMLFKRGSLDEFLDAAQSEAVSDSI